MGLCTFVFNVLYVCLCDHFYSLQKLHNSYFVLVPFSPRASRSMSLKVVVVVIVVLVVVVVVVLVVTY